MSGSRMVGLWIVLVTGCNYSLVGAPCRVDENCPPQQFCDLASRKCALGSRSDAGGGDAASGGGGGGAATGGGGGTLTVTISTPRADVAVSVSLHIEVVVAGGTPDAVTLSVSGASTQALAMLTSPPFAYDWDTSTLAEGLYVLTATGTAGGRSFPSSTRNVRVDHTPPVIVDRVPAPNAVNVWARDPISVTFTEPINPASLTSSSVQYFVEGAVQGASLSLADGGTTVTIAPFALPDVSQGPKTAGLNLSATVTDVAGNALTSATWSWTVPDWQDLGSTESTGLRTSTTMKLAVDPQGDPTTLAWTVAYGAINSTTLQRWNGAGWTSLTGPTAAQAGGTDLGFDARGRLVLAYVSYISSSPQTASAAVLDGTQWLDNQVLNVNASNNASGPMVQFTATGTAVAAWLESESNLNQVHAKVWSGAGWGAPATPTAEASSVSSVAVSATTAGKPIVSWVVPVSSTQSAIKWLVYSDQTWGVTQSATLPAGMERGVARISPSEAAQVAWLSSTTPATVGLYERNGLVWPLVGGSVLNLDSSVSAGSVAFTYDEKGHPVVAWTEGAALYVKRWGGTKWEQLGGNLVSGTSPPQAPFLGVGADGVVAVGCVVNGYPPQPYPVKRYNR